MSWLARMEIDASTALSRGIVDGYAWHQHLWQCFPGEPDHRRDFLTRIDPLEGAFRLWMASRRKPVCPDWCPPECFELKTVAPSFFSHRLYAFDVRANPVKCLVQRNDKGDRKKHGKRVALTHPEELRAWIERKGAAGGFQIVAEPPLEIGPVLNHSFRKREYSAFHGGVQFRGVLEVVDRQLFSQTYFSGIGSAKGFGFGLLLLAPLRIGESITVGINVLVTD